MTVLSYEDAVEVAVRQIREAASGLGPHLTGAWRELATRRPEVAAVAGSDLTHPMAQPIVASPLWAAEAAGPAALAPMVLEDVVAASVLGYLHVRVHDDFFDEASGDPHDVMMLAEALLARAHMHLARHVQLREFWSLYADRLARYAEAMLLERQARTGAIRYDATTFTDVLDRSGPLLIPPAAVLAVAERWHLVPQFDELLGLATRALQLVNDLTNVRHDLDHGGTTWVLQRLGADGGRAAVERTLVTGFDAIVAEAKQDLAAARDVAGQMASPGARAWCEAAQAELTRRQEHFYRALFGLPATDPPGG